MFVSGSCGARRVRNAPFPWAALDFSFRWLGRWRGNGVGRAVGRNSIPLAAGHQESGRRNPVAAVCVVSLLSLLLLLLLLLLSSSLRSEGRRQSTISAVEEYANAHRGSVDGQGDLERVWACPLRTRHVEGQLEQGTTLLLLLLQVLLLLLLLQFHRVLVRCHSQHFPSSLDVVAFVFGKPLEFHK